MEKYIYFDNSIQKVKLIYYIDLLDSEIFQAFISFNFDDYGLQLMKTQNSVSPKIRILHKTDKTKDF